MRPAPLRPISLVIGLLAMAAGAPSWAQQDIGETSAVKNTVTGTIGETVRRLDVADHVFQDEWIETAVESATEIVFLDETTMTFGPEARVKLDTFVFDPDPSLGKVVIDVTQGLFRLATGSMHDSAYEIRTPTATLAVRGTEIEIFVDPVTLDTEIILRDGTVLVTGCPDRAADDREAWDEPCTGETQIVVTPGTSVIVSGFDGTVSAPGVPSAAVEALVDQLDFLIVAALAEALDTAAGGETFEPPPPPPPPPPPTVTVSDAQENPSIDDKPTPEPPAEPPPTEPPPEPPCDESTSPSC